MTSHPASNISLNDFLIVFAELLFMGLFFLALACRGNQGWGWVGLAVSTAYTWVLGGEGLRVLEGAQCVQK